uniref:Uncharacterized protein n=1 Tax=Tetraselmis sp. GSL018 TaxID=582737 RepID=A0A061QRL4_9CHLO
MFHNRASYIQRLTTFFQLFCFTTFPPQKLSTIAKQNKPSSGFKMIFAPY